MTKKRKFKKEYAFELVQIAAGDLETAKGLIQIKRGRPENILFHLEQVIEKSLKSVLCFHEIPLPFTHELGWLRLQRKKFKPLFYWLSSALLGPSNNLVNKRAILPSGALTEYGWGARIRTWECWNQNPVTYRLSTPQQGQAWKHIVVAKFPPFVSEIL